MAGTLAVPAPLPPNLGRAVRAHCRAGHAEADDSAQIGSTVEHALRRLHDVERISPGLTVPANADVDTFFGNQEPRHVELMADDIGTVERHEHVARNDARAFSRRFGIDG